MCPTAGQQVQWSITSSQSPEEKIVFESEVANKNAEPSLRVENASIRLKLNDNKKKTKVSWQSNIYLGTIKSRCWVKQNSHFLWCPCSLKSWEYRQHPSLAATALNSIKLNPSQLSDKQDPAKNFYVEPKSNRSCIKPIIPCKYVIVTLTRQYAQLKRWMEKARLRMILANFTKTGPIQYDISSSSRLLDS